MQKIILKIKGMSCSACSSGLEKYLSKQNGIIDASVNLVLAQAMIQYEEELTLEDLDRFIKEAGYESLGPYDAKEEENQNNKEKKWWIFYSFLAFFVLYVSMAPMVNLPAVLGLHMMENSINYVVYLCLGASLFLIYGLDIIQSGYRNLIHKTPNMDTLVTIGILSSYVYSVYGMIQVLMGDGNYVHHLYFESIVMVLYFVKLGRRIDFSSKEKTKEAMKELVQITPSMALLKTENGEKEIPLDEIKKGNILIAKPGMKIAADGIVIEGNCHVDESFITGESVPVKKEAKDQVIAGSINYDGYIEYKAEKIGKDSTISEIVRLVMESTNTKPKIARIADFISGIFVPTVMIISLITFLGYLFLGFELGDALISFVTVLVVACPCALGLATPLAIVVSEGMCAKNGILVKTSETLETASQIDTIIFDKTGTLTYGNLKISEIKNYSKYKEKELLERLISIESKSSHPISTAFKELGASQQYKERVVKDFQNIEGIGVKGKIQEKEYILGNYKILKKLKIENPYQKEEQELASIGNTIIYGIEEKQIIALIGVQDIVRETSKEVVKELLKQNKEVIMLTGDHHETALRIAKTIGIKTVIADVMPKEKNAVIKKRIAEGKKVMMVGDGINDAPSLITADVGISIHSGTDIAIDSADVILIRNDLRQILTFLTVSKQTMRNIKQNLFWAFFYNLCMIPIAIGILKPVGITMNPMIASIAMMLSSFTVILNALRLKRLKIDQKGEKNVSKKED